MADFSKIKAFAFDIDGVMTEGTLLAMPDGDFLRIYDAKDGFGVRMAAMNGYGLAIITGGSSESIPLRCMASGFKREDIYLHSRDKVEDFRDYCARHGYSPEEVLYMGDDLPDIPVMAICGVSACPANAVPEVREFCSFVSDFGGGKGAVRQAIESVMKAQGRWTFDVGVYKKTF